METALDRELMGLAERAMENKKVAQQLGIIIKSGKIKRLLEIAVGARGSAVTSYSSVYHDMIWIYVSVNNLDGMKDNRLIGILSAYEHLNPEATMKTQDIPSALEREFKYRWSFSEFNKPTIQVYVSITARIKNDSETCRREVVGYTDGKPEPIYKLVCDDQEEAMDEVHAKAMEADKEAANDE